MRAKTPPFKPFETKEERETALKEFIRGALDEAAAGREDAIAVLALSPSSPVIAALLALSDELAGRRVGASIVLAGGATAAEDETWSLSFSAKFIHEIRLTSNPRILDGHEQLIVGDRSLWYGDCMRRDPSKRDAFASFLPDQPATVRASRFAFGQLWRGAQSIYRNAALASLVVTSTTTGGMQTLSAVPAVTSDLVEGGEINPGSVTETLAAWQPLTRH